ncbi:MAG TPA: aminotransferase class V-fold PLP-dependent enzyme [Candidatus Limnocylindrales bacterium]|nr:aminotransferase class V-fold PLP-dependent enzyme [Candidatus Limnocylindrales bacterium]
MITNARELFVLDPHVAHLNHGSFGSVPIPVRQERLRLLDEYDANPLRVVVGDLWERVADNRTAAARFLGADPDLCALVMNATVGVALALNTVRPGAGDEIVITDHSYHAVTLAVEDQVERFGAKVVVAPIDLDAGAAEAVAAVMSAVTERTRLVIVDEISSATAKRHPIAELATRLRQMGVPLLVDAAHSPGMLPRPLSGMDPDFWVGNMHKWAFAPGGTALMRVSADWRDRITPLVVSHAHLDGYPRNVEQQGTRDHTTWLALKAGLAILDRFGEAEIQRHNTELAAYGQRVIGEALGLNPADLPSPGDHVSMRVIPLPPGLVTDLPTVIALYHRIADELATETAINVWRGEGLLRVSAQIYNSPEEYDRLAQNLPSLLRRFAAERA